jgi:hypothetical protein
MTRIWFVISTVRGRAYSIRAVAKKGSEFERGCNTAYKRGRRMEAKLTGVTTGDKNEGESCKGIRSRMHDRMRERVKVAREFERGRNTACESG